MEVEEKKLERVSSNILTALVALDEGLGGYEFIVRTLLEDSLETITGMNEEKSLDINCTDSVAHMKRPAPILIAGMGSCGTTMVCDHLSRQCIKPNVKPIRLGKPAAGYVFVRDLKETHKRKNYHRTCVKTHDFAPSHELKYKHGPEITKCIYMFAEPKTVVTRAAQMNEEHWRNLHVEEKYFGTQEYLNQDIFRLEEQFLSWLKPHNNYDVLAVRYETLWGHESEIREFVGDSFSFTLPEYKTRKTDWKEHSDADRLQNTYKSLSNLIISTEDISLYNKSC